MPPTRGITRVVLVDPRDETRQQLQRLLGAIGSIWLAEVCASYASASTTISEIVPDMTVIVMDSDLEQAISLIQAIRRVIPDAMIVVATSNPKNPEFLMGVVRLHINEIISLPIEMTDLIECLRKVVLPQSSGTESNVPKMVAVTGAAGGIGCTTIATNMATTLARTNPSQSVVLVDFDMLFGAVDSCLDIIPDTTILDILASLDKMDLSLLKRSLLKHSSSGLFVLPHPTLMEDVVKIHPDHLRRMLGMLKAAFDTVAIDCSKGLQGSDMVALEFADIILLVVQLDLNCLRNTARLMQLFRSEGAGDKVRIVVNRVGSNTQDIGIRRAEEVLGLPLSFQVPNDSKNFSEAMRRGVPLDQVAKNSPATKVMQDIAKMFQTNVDDAKPAEDHHSRRGRGISLF